MKPAYLFIALVGAAWPAFGATAVAESRAVQQNAELDSVRLEKELQSLSWRQFRAVVESQPRLKAAVDAYGPLGWQFVQANYRNYGWRRNIDKLDVPQRRLLAEQISRARTMR